MNHRPMSRILDEVSHERGKQAKLGSKLRANRERNWLLALTLNTFAKAADDLPTNDLPPTEVPDPPTRRHDQDELPSSAIGGGGL